MWEDLKKIIVQLNCLVMQIHMRGKDYMENCIWIIGLLHRQKTTLTGTIVVWRKHLSKHCKILHKTIDARQKLSCARKNSYKDLVHLATQELSGSGLVQNLQIEIVEEETNQPQNPVKKAIQENLTDLQQENSSQEEVVAPNDDGVTIEGGNHVNYRFVYKHAEYLFHIIFDMSDPTMDWLLVEAEGKNEYTLSINMRHSFFKPLN